MKRRVLRRYLFVLLVLCACALGGALLWKGAGGEDGAGVADPPALQTTYVAASADEDLPGSRNMRDGGDEAAKEADAQDDGRVLFAATEQDVVVEDQVEGWDASEPFLLDGADEVVEVDGTEGQEPEPYVIPLGMRYEPKVALVQLDPHASLDEVRGALEGVESIENVSVSQEDLERGYVRVQVAQGFLVEDAVTELSAAKTVLAAQANFLYDEYELMDSEGVAEDAEVETDGASDALVEQAQEALAASAAIEPDERAAGEQAEEEPQAGQDVYDAQSDAYAVDESQAGQAVPEELAEVEQQAGLPAPKEEEGLELVAEQDEAGGEAALELVSEPQEPELTTEATSSPVNDPKASAQWALQSMQAFEAWATARSNRNVAIAVVDGGFDANHEDLVANVLAPYNSGDKKSGKSALNTAEEGDVHGTHVAGIASAEAHNGVGIAGVAYNANIVPVAARNGKGIIDTQSLLEAWGYILRQPNHLGVRVITTSLGGTSLEIEKALANVIQRAFDAGIVTVNSAGNYTYDYAKEAWIQTPYAHYPSDIPNVVGVIALEEGANGIRKADFSNCNRSDADNKNISAPGSNILSCLPGNSYGEDSGTSMAAPQVAGVLALMFAANPSLSARDAIDILYATATDLGAAGWDRTYGWGEVNAYRAVYGAINGVSAAKKLTLRERELAVQAAGAKSLRYRSFVTGLGWQAWRSNGALSGTTKARPVEGLQLKLVDAPYDGNVQYSAYLKGSGWTAWKTGGKLAGTTNGSKHIEAVRIRLTGVMAERYDVWYRATAQSYGKLGWAKNGAKAGTVTFGRYLRGVEVRLLPKGSKAPGSTSKALVTRLVQYRSYACKLGWRGWSYDGKSNAVSKQANFLEALRVKLCDPKYAGGIRYKAHAQGVGWQGWRKDGKTSGSTSSKRLEAIKVALTGTMAKKYDVWYRVRVQTYGWLGWTKNGKAAGTTGLGKKVTGVQIRLVAKGGSAPGPTKGALRTKQ